MNFESERFLEQHVKLSFVYLCEPLIHNMSFHQIRPQNMNFVPWMDISHIINY